MGGVVSRDRGDKREGGREKLVDVQTKGESGFRGSVHPLLFSFPLG